MICPNCGFDNLPGSEDCNKCNQDLTQLDRPVAHDRVERSLMEDPVINLHPREPVTILADSSVQDAIQAMLHHNIGALLVVDSQGALLGIFSERDLMAKAAAPNRDYSTTPVREFMTPNPECVQATDTLAFALHKMDVGEYRHLPVLDEGKPVGMMSVRDMLRHITRLCKP
jgi:CBS domain-containing protein